MDIDAFRAAHGDQWARLDRLVGRRRLNGAEADELVWLYRSAARDLSRLRTGAPDPQLISEMSMRVAAARGRLTGSRAIGGANIIHYLTVDVPAALYRVRWWTVGVTVVEVLPMAPRATSPSIRPSASLSFCFRYRLRRAGSKTLGPQNL